MLRWTILILLLLTAPSQAGGRMVIVVGAEGEAEYGRSFQLWADRFAAAAMAGRLRVEQIGRDAASELSSTRPASTSTSTTVPTSDKDKLKAALALDSPPADEPLWLILIGHGTSDGVEAKFNLRGPDVSDKELAEWLRPYNAPIALLDCSSASGSFLNRLSGPNRVVVTATRTGSEYQFSRFGEFLSGALADPAADLDKDGQTSVLEAFLSASHGVNAYYKQNGRIVTEHALLDDNGDGLGVSADWFQGIRATRSAKNGATVDGPAAHRWVLRPTAAEESLSPERRSRRDALEASLDALRQQKPTMPQDMYYSRLESLMIELARTYE